MFFFLSDNKYLNSSEEKTENTVNDNMTVE